MVRIARTVEKAPIQIHIDAKNTWDLVKLFTIEYCPHCDTEQVIWSHGVTACPHCGKPLAPCSVCHDEAIADVCYNCPYGCNDQDNPAPITMPDINEDDANWLYQFL